MRNVLNLLFLMALFLANRASADVVGENCPPKATGNLETLIETVQKSDYLLKRDHKLAINRKRIEELLAKKDIIGVELIVAGESDRSFASRWGHAMLRFVDSDGDWRNDYVISFVLDQTEEEMSTAKALFGGYPIIPETKTFGEFWGYYSKGEARSLDRVIIPTDAKMRKKLLETFKKRSENVETLGSYTFLSNNCAGVLSKLLSDAGFPHQGKSSVPTKMEKWLQKSLMSPYPDIKVTPPKNTLDKVSKILGVSYVDLVYGDNYPDDAYEKLKDKLSEKEKHILYYNVEMLPDSLTRKLAPEIQKSDMSVDEVYGFHPIDKSFYSTCHDVSCVKTKEAAAEKIWSQKDLEKVRESRRENYFHAYYDENAFTFSSDDGEVPDIGHPWFDIDDWHREKDDPRWLNGKKEISKQMRTMILLDPQNRDIYKKECGKKDIQHCLEN